MYKKTTNKQRIALTTWWHYHNYGTALQVTALYTVIKSLGYDVDVINYIPSGTRYPTNFWGDTATDRGKSERVKDKSRDIKFDDYLHKHLSFTQKCIDDKEFEALNDGYDAFITGSDQIWSPICFDPRYFLDFVNDNRKKIAYAPSTGLPVVKNKYVREQMINLISQFAHLSVREKHGAKLIGDLVHRDAEVVLDPTLLLDYADWRKIIPLAETGKNEKGYILCYFLGENKNTWKHVSAIARSTGLPIKILPVFLKDSQYGEFKTGAGPEEFFNLIDNAEIVLTDSFHGVIFSSICGKPFYVFERFKSQDKLSQNSRVYNFLEMIDLSDKLIGYNDDVKGEYTFNVDYTAPKKTIAYERKKSLDYLKNSLYTENPLVSIIVPVYNVEKYIKQCLDSISAQTYQNIEIIVVDDGTPDDSGKIADECAGKDDRVKVIHQENGGISRARNAGYDMATGEYIVFVDSDDAIAPDYVEYMLGLIENTGTDIARVKDRFDYRNFDQVESDKFERVPSVEILKNMEYHHDGIEVWNKIYRKSFLEKNKIRHFDEIEFGEGMTFNAYALLHTDFIGVGRRRVYYYRHNFDSAVRKFVWDDRRKTLAIALDYRGKFFAESGNKTLQKALEYHIWLNAFYFYRGLLSLDDPKQQQDLAKYYHLCRTKISGVMLADKSKISKKGIIKAILIFLSPKIMAILINKREREINQDLLKKVNKGVFNLDKMPWENPKPKIRRKHWINHHLGIKGCIKLILIKLLPYKIQRLIRGKQ